MSAQNGDIKTQAVKGIASWAMIRPDIFGMIFFVVIVFVFNIYREGKEQEEADSWRVVLTEMMKDNNRDSIKTQEMLQRFVNGIENSIDKQQDALNEFIMSLNDYNDKFIELEKRRISMLADALVQQDKHDRKVAELEARIARLSDRMNMLYIRQAPVYQPNYTDPK